jgi:thioesterase domain-containing protein
MAHQLLAEGRKIAALVMFDTPAPYSDYRFFRWTPRSLVRFIVNFHRWLGDFVRLEPAHVIGRFKRHMRIAASRLRPSEAPAQSWEIDLGTFFDAVDQIPPEIRRLMEIELAAFQQYRVRPYAGRVTLMRAKAQPLFCSHDPAMGWGGLAQGGIDIIPCPGSHHTLLREPHVRGLAAQLRAHLEGIDALL